MRAPEDTRAKVRKRKVKPLTRAQKADDVQTTKKALGHVASGQIKRGEKVTVKGPVVVKTKAVGRKGTKDAEMSPKELLALRVRQEGAARLRDNARKTRASETSHIVNGALQSSSKGRGEEARDADLRREVRTKVVAQRKTDDANIKRLGSADPNQGALAPAFRNPREQEKGKDEKQLGSGASRLAESELKTGIENRKRSIARGQDPSKGRTQRTVNQVKDEQLREETLEKVVRQGKDLTPEESRRVIGADEQITRSIDHKKKKDKKSIGGLAKNAVREVRDAVSNAPATAQVLAGAGREQVSKKVGLEIGGTKNSDAIAKGLKESPGAKLIQGDVKGAVDAAYKMPLSAIGDATLVGGVGSRLATAGVRAAKGAEHVAQTRARPNLEVREESSEPKKGRKGTQAQKKARKAAQAGQRRSGESVIAAKPRTYHKDHSVRAVQKASDVVKAAVGRDPNVATGRKAKRIVKKDTITRQTREQEIGRRRESVAATGELADREAAPTLATNRNVKQERAQETDRGRSIVAQHLYGHVDTSSAKTIREDVTDILASAERELETGHVYDQAFKHAEAQGHRRPAETAEKAQEAALETIAALTDFQKAYDVGEPWATKLVQHTDDQGLAGKVIGERRAEEFGLDAKQQKIRAALGRARATGRAEYDPSSESWKVRDGEGWRPLNDEDIETFSKGANYMKYDKAETFSEVGPMSVRDAATGFTGAGIHGTRFGERTLGDHMGGLQRDVNEKRTVEAALKHATGAKDGQPLNQANAQQLAKAKSRGGIPHVPVEVGRVGEGTLKRSSHDAAGPDEPGRYVVMPKVDAKMFEKMRQNESRSLAAGQMASKAFYRAVLPLNPLWHLGNNADMVTRLALMGWRKGDSKIPDQVRQGMLDSGMDLNAVEQLMDSVLGHVGATKAVKGRTVKEVVHSGHEPGSREVRQGRRTSLGEGLHRKFTPLQQSRAKRAVDQLIDSGFNLASRTEQGFIRAAQGQAARQLAQDLPQGIDNWVELGRRMRQEPELRELFYEQTLAIIGDYVRHAPSTRGWGKVALPFVDWIKASSKFVFMTLPAQHPVKVALYLIAAQATEEQRRLFGMSDYITKAEAKALMVPEPIDGFLGGGITMGETVFPAGFLSSFGEAAGLLNDPVGQLGGHLLPQVNQLVSAALGHSGAETTYQGRRALKALGVKTGTAQADKGGDLTLDPEALAKRGLAAGTAAVKSYVPLAGRAMKEAGLNKGPQQGGIVGSAQGGQGDGRDGDLGPVLNAAMRVIGTGAQAPEPYDRSVKDTALPNDLRKLDDETVVDVATGDNQPGYIVPEQLKKEERTDPAKRARRRAKRTVKSIGRKPVTLNEAKAMRQVIGKRGQKLSRKTP